MRTFCWATGGFLLESVIAWGALLSWAVIVLDPQDSYWDRTSGGADLFFVVWLLFAIASSVGAAWWSRRPFFHRP